MYTLTWLYAKETSPIIHLPPLDFEFFIDFGIQFKYVNVTSSAECSSYLTLTFSHVLKYSNIDTAEGPSPDDLKKRKSDKLY